MNILLSGINGFMGKEVVKIINQTDGLNLVGGVDVNADENCPVTCVKTFNEANEKILKNYDVNCIIDFSHHSATNDLINFAVENKIPLVLATTGQTEEEKQVILNASKYIPLFYSANYSLGVALLVELAKKTASAFPDAEIEIIEKHHNRKVDAPSGTALMIADAIKTVRPETYVHNGRSGQGKREKNEIGVHAIRMGNIVGEHEVIVGTQNQQITLKHEAFSRSLFAEGAISAVKFLEGKPIGHYTMTDIVKG